VLKAPIARDEGRAAGMLVEPAGAREDGGTEVQRRRAVTGNGAAPSRGMLPSAMPPSKVCQVPAFSKREAALTWSPGLLKSPSSLCCWRRGRQRGRCTRSGCQTVHHSRCWRRGRQRGRCTRSGIKQSVQPVLLEERTSKRPVHPKRVSNSPSQPVLEERPSKRPVQPKCVSNSPSQPVLEERPSKRPVHPKWVSNSPPSRR
jgi:hypothetical protein